MAVVETHSWGTKLEYCFLLFFFFPAPPPPPNPHFPVPLFTLITPRVLEVARVSIAPKYVNE